MIPHGWPPIQMLVLVLVVASLTIMVGHDVVTEMDAQIVSEMAAWCDQHNGTLANSNVIGGHGGWHCQLENGTTVHMNETNLTVLGAVAA
jgi:hypothetical protein